MRSNANCKQAGTKAQVGVRTSKCQNILFYNTQKKLKSLTMPKKIERGTLWDFSTSILSQNSKNQKKLKGGPLGKKLAIPKKTFWSRSVLYVTRETFLVQFPGPTEAI